MKRSLLLFVLLASSLMLAMNIKAQDAENALSFDGSNDYVSIPDDAVFKPDTVTIEMWVLMNNTNDATILGKPNSRGPYGAYREGYEIRVSNNRFTAVMANNGNQKTAWQVYPLVAGRWYFIAAVFSRTGVSLYVNGKLEQTTPTGFPLDHGAFPVVVGMAPSFGSYAGMKFEDLRIFNKPRSAAQIEADMTSFVSLTEPGLVAYYNFDHGTPGGINTGAAFVNDVTAGSRFATLYNFALSGSSSNWVSSYALTIPKLLAETNIGSTSFTANWTAPEVGIASTYQIELTLDSTFGVIDHLFNTLSAGTSYTMSGIDAGARYYYRVRADRPGANGSGAHSQIRTVDMLPLPVIIDSIVPETSWAGGTITIYGSNMRSAASVNIAGVPVRSFKPLSATSITAVLDSSLSGKVTVVSPSGADSIGGFIFTPVPQITSAAPMVLTTTPQTLKVKGKYLSTIRKIEMIGLPSPFTIVSDSEITVSFIGIGDPSDNRMVFTSPAGVVAKGGFTVQLTKVNGSFTIVSGSTTTLTAIGVTPITWYDDSTGGNLLHTGAVFTTPSLTNATHYWLSANNTTRKKISISVLDSAVVSGISSASATPNVSGQGDTVRLSATVPMGMVNWYMDSVGGAPFESTFSGHDLIVNPSATTTYYAEQSLKTDTFRFIGSGTNGIVQTWTVPAGVYNIKVEAVGSKGGGFYARPSWTFDNGGLGGLVKADLNVTPGQVLYIYTGKEGGLYGASQRGWNGGSGRVNYGGGGGDATDIRMGGTDLSNRIVVAGGGGGGGVNGSAGSCWGGSGGGLIAGNIHCNYGVYTIGGSQVAAGVNGGLGYGALGQNSKSGAGGGSGYYGGGMDNLSGSAPMPGAGGSSYTDPYMCYNVEHQAGVNYGSGYVIISYYVPEPKRVPVTVRMFDLPVITSFTPTDAGAGDSITIRGTNFQYGVRGVRLGEVPVASYTVYGDTIIKAVVGGGSSGNLRIVGAGGSTVKSGFVFILSGNVFSYTPIRADSAGSTVQFFGSRLGAVSEVKFGGTPASSFQVISGAVLKAVTDTGSNGDIELKTPGGITTMEDFWYGSVPGNALSFDGGNDFVSIANPTLGGDFTIEFWMKTTQHGPGEWLDWPQGAGIVNGEIMGAVADFGTSLMGSKLGFGTGPTSSSSLRDYTIKSVSDVNTGQWTHVAVTRAKNTGLIQLYINGVLESSATAAPGMLNAPPRLVLGAQQTENNFFKGSLDEVRIWTNVRSGAQIAANMRVSATGLEGGLASLYNFDKGIPAGNNSRFTTVGEMSFHQSPGALRNFTLTGTTSNFVKSYAMLQSQFYSFAPSVVLPYDTITLKGTYMNHTLDVSVGNTIVPFTILSDSELIATAPVTTGFTQRSVTVRTIAGTSTLPGLTVYGIELDTFSPANIIPGTVVTIKGKLLNYVTGVKFGTLQAASFTILSDSVITAVVPVAGYMTADSLSVFGGGESISLHGLSFIGVPGIASFTPKNGVADTVMSITGTDFVNVTAVSVGGMPVDSFWVVSPSLIKAVLGAGSTGAVKVTTVLGSASQDGFLYNAYSSEDLCLNFDGGDDHVRIDRPVQNDFTIEYWMRTTQVGPQVTAWPGGIGIVDGEVGGVVDDYGTSLIGDNVAFGVGVPSKGTDSTLKSVTKVNTGRWVHVAATRKQATGRIELYVNGVLEDSCTTANTSQLTSPGTLVMGMIQTMNNAFRGEIDDVRFWDVVKTASEIRVYKDSIMKGTETNLVAYYDFDIGESGGNNAQFNILFNKKGTSLANSGGVHNFALNGNTSNWVKSYAHSSPDITFITPQHVPDSTPVEIHGTRFTEVIAVSSGGESATSYEIISDTLIVARFGNGRTGQVKVTTPVISDSMPGLLIMYTPVLSSFSPVNAGPGLIIKIGGRWFDSTTSVTVGGMAAQFTVLSTETLSVVVPLNATLNDKIVVTTLYGSAEKGGYTYFVTPTLTAFAPKAIATGDTMYISGKEFTTTTGITIGGVPVSYTVVSDSLIKAIVSTGVRDSVVVTTYGGIALDTGFVYIYPPDIKSFLPATANEGDIITIKGEHFTTTTAVKLGGLDVTSFVEFSDSVIEFTVPYTVTGNVSVTALGGTSHKSGFFYGDETGNAIKLDGHDDYFSVPSSAGLTASTITVEAWVLPNESDGFILAKANPRASDYFPMHVEGYQLSLFGGRFRADMAGPALYSSNRSVESAPFTQGVWYHVAVVYTATEMSMYVNGIFQQSTATGYALFHGSHPLIIGGGPLLGGHADCSIDELRIFSTDRSAYINSDMNVLLPAETPGLEAYYSFDRGVPGGLNPGIISLPDMTGHGNTATLTHSALSGIGSNWVRSDAMNQPEITSFYPPAQLPGSTVTVTGKKLAGLSEVAFGGVAAESFTINSDSEVVAVVASGGATGIVTVTSAGGISVMGGFTALIPPVIGSFTPVEAGAGITITITGTDFKDVTDVSIGGVPVASYTVVSINTITAVVNNGATSGVVSVTTNAGTAVKTGFVFYEQPVITSFTPTAASPTVNVTIEGHAFTSTSGMTIGGVTPASFVIESDSVIQAIVGNGTVVNDSIVITTAAGVAAAGGFTTLPQVAIQYFTPANAEAGDTITITGSKLFNATSVSFGNVPARSFTALSDSLVVAVLDSGSSGNIDVMTPDFGKVSRNGFWYGYNAGNALNMTSGSAVAIPDAPQLHEQEVTVGFWVKLQETGSYQTLVRKGNLSIVLSSGNLYFLNNSSQRLLYTGITAGEWYHISLVAFNDGGQLVILVYLNGERNRFVLGANIATGTWSFGGNAAFEIDEFKIYKGDRSDENWWTGIPGTGMMKSDVYGEADPSDTTLLAYYSFNTGIPGGNNPGLNGLADLSRFHNDGVLYNFTLNGNTSNWVTSTIPFGPKINLFTPDTAYLGDTITIRGKRLNSTSVVSFGGVPATSFTTVSDNMIMAVVGDAASGKVVVGSGTNGEKLSDLPNFTFIPEARISSFTPAMGGEGTLISVYGKYFTGLSAVSFGGVAADSFAFVNDTMVTAVVDTGASGEVSITSAHGTAVKPGFAYYAEPPSIISFEPDSASTGDTITIKGTLLTSVTDMEIAGVDASYYTILSDSVIKAVVGLASSGTVNITTLFGTTSEPGFFYIHRPYILSFTPGAAAATAVTITGVNFTGVTAVSFGGVSSPSFTVDNDSSITAYTGLGASGEIKVTGPLGIGTTQGFVYYRQPVISSFTPTSGATGHTITIKGSGFNGVTGVNFGATASASFTILSDTVITAVVNNGSTGGINVSGPGGTGFRNGFSYVNLPSDNTLPTITHNTVCNQLSVTSLNVTNVSITDANSINTTAGTKPRLYYKKITDANVINGNTNATQGWKYAEANGIASPFDFTVDYSKLYGGSVATGDTISYFIVAQDKTAVPNTAIDGGSFATAPVSVNLATANLPSAVSHKYFIGRITPAATVATAQTDVCAGRTITFTVTPVYGGSTPAYQWKKNSVNVGTGASYSSNAIADNDTVYCVMTSNYNTTCPVATLTPVSNKLVMNVGVDYTVNNPQTICNGGAYAYNGHTYTTAGTYRDTLHTTIGCDSIIVTQLTVNPVYTTNNVQNICSGTSYILNGHTYTANGTYKDTLHSVNGCDSIVVTQLTVNPVYSVNNPQTICSVSSYNVNGHTYTTAGTYRDTLHAATGCDSIIVTQLMVQPTFTINNPQTICNGSTYSFNGHSYTAAGIYRDTLGCTIIITQLNVSGGTTGTNLQTICSGRSYTFNNHTYIIAGTYHDTIQTAFGCDSFVVTQLIVNPVYTVNNPQTICSGNIYAFNGHSYTIAGAYHDTLHTSKGCDSIIVTQLTVNPVYVMNNPQTICSGGSYTFNGHTYTTAANYRDTLHSVNGCDSIIVTQLTVNPVYLMNNPQTICSGSSYSFNGHSYAIAASYRDTLHTVNGCDSIVVTQLTVNPTYTTNNLQAICSGRSYSFNGHSYSTAGSYNDTLHAVTGCDSIIVTQLTVNPVYSVNNPQTICSGGSYAFNGHTYTTTATYRDTLHTSMGCDSIIVTQLTVNPVYSMNNPQTICADGSYTFNGHTYTTAASYRDTLHAVTGCDSIIVTQLTVNPVYSVSNPQMICPGSSYAFNGHTYTTAATYRDTLHTSTGCDSIIVTQLTVNPVYSVSNPQTICSGGSYSFNGHSYTAAASYRDTLHTINGCDSIIVTELTVNPAYSVSNPQTICSGGSYSFNGHTYTTAASYRDTLHSATGCDSIIVTQLTVNPVYSVNNPQTICAGGSYTFNGHTYATAATYRDTLHAANGCDSIIVTQLMVNPVYSVNNIQSVCSGRSYVLNGHVYANSGMYRDTLHSINGCDSIIVTQLTVNPVYSFNNPRAICSGNSYTINGHTYTTVGTYKDTLQTATSCDSIIVTQLTVSPAYAINNPQSVCSGSSYAFNGHTYTASGTYRDTLHTVTGCDSILITQLTVYPSYTVNNPQNICSGTTYSINGHTYAGSGTYRDTLHTVNGCDSIVVTQLSVNPSFTINNNQQVCSGASYSYNGHTYTTSGTYYDTVSCTIIATHLTVLPLYTTNNPKMICDGSVYTINGHAYTLSGTYHDTLHTAAGCDSIVVTQLTIAYPVSINNPQTICSGSSYTLNGHAYAIAATYRDTLHTAAGCDSIIVTQLTVNPVYSRNNPQSICSGGSYSFNGHTYTVNGNYNDTLHSINGCDSIIVTQLTVNPLYTMNNPVSICSGSSYSFNGHTYTANGSYNDTLHTSTGCDSIIVTQLTVNPVYSMNNPVSICSGSSYSFNGHTYTANGSYNDTLHTSTGCDSIIVTQLTVNPVYTMNNPQTICNGSSYSFNGHTYTANGNYNDTLRTSTGCDSIIVTQLTVNPIYSVNNPQAICNGSSYSFNGHTYTANGSYNDTLHTSTGCDSIIVTQLTVNPVYSVNNSQAICSGNSYTINGHVYTITGNYTDTLHTINGCDSIITTQLTVNPKPTATVATTGVTQFCQGGSVLLDAGTTSGLNYRWLNNNAPVALATNAVYEATTSGNYRLVVTDAGSCADTSSAIVVTVNTRPATSPVNGEADPEINTVHAYSVTGSVGSTYNWLITGGTRISGGNSSLIVVQWGNVAGTASIRVIETNSTGCAGDTITQMTDVALPVKLISFKAKRENEHVKLEWSTASELNNDYFTIQRSTDGKHFESIEKVKGNGTTNSVTNYLHLDNTKSFTSDLSPLTSVYYRLIQTDYDGTSTASQIISVDLNKLSATMQVSVQPNPFTDHASVIVNNAETAQATLRITDMNGKVIGERTVELYKGETEIALTELTDRSFSGVYFVHLITDKQSIMTRIMKAK